jgi:hypothetical protein
MARELKVLFTLMNGEHRIQVNGPEKEVEAVAKASNRLLTMYRFDLASTPETNYEPLLLALRQDDSHTARRVKSLLPEARTAHWRQFPDCPHRERT